MIKKIKNATQAAKTWCGQEIAAGAYYQIQPLEYIVWAHDSEVLKAIGNEEIIVNNGCDDITDIDSAIEYLKSETPAIVELFGINKQTIDGSLKVALTPSEGSSAFFVSHDFCDRTTWWTESVLVENEELEHDLLYLIYRSDNSYWIDLEHGKVAYEDRYVSTYKPHIYVDGVEKTPTQGNYVIDYNNGKVVFGASQVGKTITATYHYENGSAWKVTPDSGKLLRVMGTEIKLSKDVHFTDGQEIIFAIKVSGQTVMSVAYKSVRDFVKCAMGRISVIPFFGGLTNDVLVLPFNYVTSKDLKSSLSMEISISLKKHEAVDGEWSSISASCINVNE